MNTIKAKKKETKKNLEKMTDFIRDNTLRQKSFSLVAKKSRSIQLPNFKLIAGQVLVKLVDVGLGTQCKLEDRKQKRIFKKGPISLGTTPYDKNHLAWLQRSPKASN